MKKIIVIRPIEVFNKNCSYRICIDDGKEIELENGEVKTIEINAKSEFLTAKLHWLGSNKFEIIDITTGMVVEVRGNKFLNYWLPIFAVIPLFGFSYAMNSKQEILKNLGIVALIALLAFVVVALTIGRNKWLNINSAN